MGKVGRAAEYGRTRAASDIDEVIARCEGSIIGRSEPIIYWRTGDSLAHWRRDGGEDNLKGWEGGWCPGGSVGSCTRMGALVPWWWAPNRHCIPSYAFV